jgi:ATP-dependent DNA helicase PIF1
MSASASASASTSASVTIPSKEDELSVKLAALNTEQRLCVELAQAGHNLFVTGGAGTGKSFTIEVMVLALNVLQKRVALTATTGNAAVHIGGTTLHHFGGFGLETDDRDELRRRAKSRRCQDSFNNIDVLVIDEVSMLSPAYFEQFSIVAQTTRSNSAPFGGLQVIACGDFFQLPPVVTKHRSGKNKLSLDKPQFACETPLWAKTFLCNVELIQVFRQCNDPPFVKMLNRCRWGKPSQEDIRLLSGRLNAQVGTGGIRPTFLHARKDEVQRINNECLNLLTATPREYRMVDGFVAGSSEPTDVLPTQPFIAKTIHRLREDVPADDVLTLKVGAQVMLITNLSQQHQLVNGSRGVVVRFTTTEPIYPVVRFAKSEVTVRAYMWKHVFRNGVYAYVAAIPLKLAYAYTIHKSQSQSMDCVQIQLDKTVWEEGQAYTAISRVRSLAGLTLSAFDPSSIRANERIVKFYTNLGQNPINKLMIANTLQKPPPRMLNRSMDVDVDVDAKLPEEEEEEEEEVDVDDDDDLEEAEEDVADTMFDAADDDEGEFEDGGVDDN